MHVFYRVHSFYKNLFYKNTRLKNAQNLRTRYEHTEAEERRRTFVLVTAKIMEIIYFSPSVHQSNIAVSVSHVQTCFYIFF